LPRRRPAGAKQRPGRIHSSDIDGHSFDEVLLTGFGVGTPVIIGIRSLVNHQHGHRPTTPDARLG
jgi:hypothetical protein